MGRRDNETTFPVHLSELMRISAQLDNLREKYFLNYYVDFIVRLIYFLPSLYMD